MNGKGTLPHIGFTQQFAVSAMHHLEDTLG